MLLLKGVKTSKKLYLPLLGCLGHKNFMHYDCMWSAGELLIGFTLVPFVGTDQCLKAWFLGPSVLRKTLAMRMEDCLGSTCLHPGPIMNIPILGFVSAIGLTVSCIFSEGRFALAHSFTTFNLSYELFAFVASY